MYSDVKIGDLVYTGQGEVYMVSALEDFKKRSIVATTVYGLGLGYRGTICYLENQTILDLLESIQEEEGIVKIVSGETLGL